jgi:putative N-acetyltransferase (TIGR04045 family)
MLRDDQMTLRPAESRRAEFVLDGDRRGTVRTRRAPAQAPVAVPQRRRPRISIGPPSLAPALVPVPDLRLLEATGDASLIAGYRALRREAFVRDQGLFEGHDLDAHDDDPRTRVLVVIEREGRVVGGVRVHPAQLGGRDLGWWRGSRLVAKGFRDLRAGSIGSALVQGACRVATEEGVLRFDAHVQAYCEPFFTRLGWERAGELDVAGVEHVSMRWPVQRFAQLAAATKSPIGRLAGDLLPGDGPMAAWLGDDGMPLAGTGLVACVDAILPTMVERDPEWAGWCGMLVTAHDLSAMGASPFAALDTIGAKDEATLARVVAGLKAGAEMFDLPIVGGHTQLGTAGHLTVTGLGRAVDPVPAGGGAAGDAIQVTADLSGGWRRGYEGRQWDSSTHRSRDQMREMLDAVGAAQPHAAKDVSMAGIVGTTGMLAEASGCGAELVVGQIPRPSGASLAEWLTCFPGFAMVTATAPDAAPMPAGEARSARCGTLQPEPGVRLRWPDGEITNALGGHVTGLGEATKETVR